MWLTPVRAVWLRKHFQPRWKTEYTKHGRNVSTSTEVNTYPMCFRSQLHAQGFLRQLRALVCCQAAVYVALLSVLLNVWMVHQYFVCQSVLFTLQPKPPPFLQLLLLLLVFLCYNPYTCAFTQLLTFSEGTGNQHIIPISNSNPSCLKVSRVGPSSKQAESSCQPLSWQLQYKFIMFLLVYHYVFLGHSTITNALCVLLLRQVENEPPKLSYINTQVNSIASKATQLFLCSQRLIVKHKVAKQQQLLICVVWVVYSI